MLISIDREGDSSSCQTHKHGGTEAGIGLGLGIRAEGGSNASTVIHTNNTTTVVATSSSLSYAKEGEDCAVESYHHYESNDDEEVEMIEMSENEDEEEDDDEREGDEDGGSVVSSSVNLGSTVGLISPPHRNQPTYSHVVLWWWHDTQRMMVWRPFKEGREGQKPRRLFHGDNGTSISSITQEDMISYDDFYLVFLE